MRAVGARRRRRRRRDASWWKPGYKMSQKSVVVSIRNQQPFVNSIETRKIPRIAAVALIGTKWIPLDYQPGCGCLTGIWRELHPLEKSWDCPARWSRFVRFSRLEKFARAPCRSGLSSPAGGPLGRISASPMPPPPGTSCGNRSLASAEPGRPVETRLPGGSRPHAGRTVSRGQIRSARRSWSGLAVRRRRHTEQLTSPCPGRQKRHAIGGSRWAVP